MYDLNAYMCTSSFAGMKLVVVLGPGFVYSRSWFCNRPAEASVPFTDKACHPHRIIL